MTILRHVQLVSWPSYLRNGLQGRLWRISVQRVLNRFLSTLRSSRVKKVGLCTGHSVILIYQNCLPASCCRFESAQLDSPPFGAVGAVKDKYLGYMPKFGAWSRSHSPSEMLLLGDLQQPHLRRSINDCSIGSIEDLVCFQDPEVCPGLTSCQVYRGCWAREQPRTIT